MKNRHTHSRQRHRRASCLGTDAENQGQGHRITAGEDKAYHTAYHVANLRAFTVAPYVTQNNGITKTGKSRWSAVDGRTTRHQGYGTPQSRRAMIECIFDWGKQHGTMRKTKHGVICRATSAAPHVLATERKAQGSGLHSCHGGGWIALLAFASSHQRSHLADAHGNNQGAYKQ
ncbi:hypothetical protein [Bradyrhizobium sp. Leo121]|uniref:hypothetical protein n=1 Tax=Bradyrhizobium sp. Leo121 TaxID=1571195 RepID=UPI00102A5F5E|nr:hypothetical protein [Bradyrhizobium sp. Leo121]